MSTSFSFLSALANLSSFLRSARAERALEQFQLPPGGVLCYQELAKQLGPEQPFYALQSPGLNEGEAPAASVEAAAAVLLEQLQAVVAGLPRGRQTFHLGGWSMGGVVAFEMALQLRRKTTG